MVVASNETWLRCAAQHVWHVVGDLPCAWREPWKRVLDGSKKEDGIEDTSVEPV